MAHRAPSCASSVSSRVSSSSRWAAEPRPPSPSSDEEGENENEEEEKEERVAAVWLPALVRQGRRDVAARMYDALLPQLIDAARNARATVVLRHAPLVRRARRALDELATLLFAHGVHRVALVDGGARLRVDIVASGVRRDAHGRGVRDQFRRAGVEQTEDVRERQDEREAEQRLAHEA